MLKVMVVDDEPLARDELIYLLKRTRKVEIVGEADCMKEVLRDLEYLKVDVIFLDIQLADENGLDLARKLNKMAHRPEIVFATAYDEHALEAFELNAVDYLLKPFDEYRVHQAMEKLLKRTSPQEAPSFTKTKQPNTSKRMDKLAISVDERILLLSVEDILHISTNLGFSVIVTKNSRYNVSDSLVHLERKLQNTSIVRVHRSYLVNMDAIIEIEPWFNSTYNLKMIDGEKVPVSRTYTKTLKELIGF